MITAKFTHWDWGRDIDIEKGKHLEKNAEYEVVKVEIHPSITYVSLKGENGSYNSVMFDFFEDGKPIDVVDKNFDKWNKFVLM